MRRWLSAEVWGPYAALALLAALLALWASSALSTQLKGNGPPSDAAGALLADASPHGPGPPLPADDPSLTPTPSPSPTPTPAPVQDRPALVIPSPSPEPTPASSPTPEPTKTATPLPSPIPTPLAPRTPQLPAPVRWAYYVPSDPASRASLEAHIGEIDVLSPAWFQMDAQGRISASAEDHRPSIVRMAKERGVLVLPMVVNGPRYADLHPLLADPARRRAAIAGLVRTVEAEGYDGIHIDFEAIDAADRPHLTAFMEELAAAFKPRGWLVSQAVAAKEQERTTGWAGAYDYAALGRVNDLVVLMAYGYRTSASATPGSTAPMDWVKRTVAYAVSQVPARKLVLGLAFYGYDWNTTAGPPAKALRYSDVLALLRARGLTPSYDATAQSQTFVYWDNGQRHEVWYEDRRSVAAKAALVGQYGLAGAAGWRLGQEDPGVWEVFRMLAAGR